MDRGVDLGGSGAVRRDMSGGGFGGNIGEIEGDIIGVFGGRRGTTGCCRRGGGNGSGGGGDGLRSWWGEGLVLYSPTGTTLAEALLMG